jgi:hypothetical protein
MSDSLEKLRRKEYALRTTVDRLRRRVFAQEDPNAAPELTNQLDKAEQELAAVEEKRIAAQEEDGTTGQLVSFPTPSSRRGLDTTGLEVKVNLRLAHVPTAIYHLFDVGQTPLITCEVYAAEANEDTKRVRVSSFIEGYSARAVNTFEIDPGGEQTFDQLPSLFPNQIRDLNELTRASLNILVEDLDGAVELHETCPIWLLARTTAPLAVEDPTTGQWRDMTPYFGAFVTPNAPSLMTFLRQAAYLHPQDSLAGYQGDESAAESQVKALFDALKTKADITYVNSVIDFNPNQGFASQRTRLPRESLADHQANCIDGTVLFASLMEGISMNPGICIVPGHAFLAWETWRDSGEWKFVETTMIGSHTYEQAAASGAQTAARYANQNKLILWSLAELRTKHGITPME